MAALADMGEFVNGSPSSIIDATAVRNLRWRFRSGPMLRTAPTIPTESAKPSLGFLEPLPQADREAEARRYAALMFGVDGDAIRLHGSESNPSHSRPKRREQGFESQPTADTTTNPQFLTGQRPRAPRMARNPFDEGTSPNHIVSAAPSARPSETLADAREPIAPDYDAEWARRLFDSVDRLKWQAAGVRPSESGLAALCQKNGLTPDLVSERLSGATVLARLRSGESIAQVWARLQEATEAPTRTGKLSGRFGVAG